MKHWDSGRSAFIAISAIMIFESHGTIPTSNIRSRVSGASNGSRRLSAGPHFSLGHVYYTRAIVKID